MDNIINSFVIKDELNDEIWDFGVRDYASLKPEIRKHLLKIADDFIEFFEVESLEVDDVLFVGSLANYNWSNYSDVDLHVVIDTSNIGMDENAINQLFEAKKNAYNDKHNITIKGYDVELYAQRVDETLTSNGIYSVMYNKWVDKPNKEEINLYKDLIIKKVKNFKRAFDKIENTKNKNVKLDKLSKLKDKIKKYRKSGLSKEGEYSIENLVFKYLRRSGFIEKLNNLKILTKDDILSLENFEF